MEVQRQRSRPLVEYRGQAYDCSHTTKVLHSTRAGLAGGNPPAFSAFYLSRRMRNRTYGGVRGQRGQPLTLLAGVLTEPYGGERGPHDVALHLSASSLLRG